MKRIDDETMELTRDEQILGDFFAHLVEERGMTRAEALAYLKELSAKVDKVLTDELQMYSTAFDLVPGRGGRHAMVGVQIGSGNSQVNTFTT